MHAQTAAIENGFVYLPNEAPWLTEYICELAMFPNGKYDDQNDSTSQALAWTKQRPKGWGIFEFYRQAAREKMPPVIATVQLKPPSPVSTFFTINGLTACATIPSG